MLTELVIENLALFQRASLSFGPGLNVITGETGAGKSLLIDALELLLGERPRASIVRRGADEARVEGRFVLSKAASDAREIRAFFAENLPATLEDWDQGGADDERELILSRALAQSGKTRAWVNHRPVTQRLLKELAGLLVEIHGQNEHQRLLETSEQTRLLDAFGGLEDALAHYRDARARWLELVEETATFERASRERSDRVDLLRFQARELSEARLSVEEHGDLERERERLRHANDLARDVGGSLEELAGEDGGALQAVKHASRVIESFEGKVSDLAPHAEELRQAILHLDEAVGGLERFLSRVEPSPERLEQVEERLYLLETLQKKYRTDVAGLLERQSEIERDLAALDARETSLEQLSTRCATARRELVSLASELTKKRRAVVARLRKAVHASLADLGLERASFEARISARGANDSGADGGDARRFALDGADSVEFVLAANPGEEAQPLRHVASGGETARIMLALRTALAVRQAIPTLVFDEVDSGVGGRLGPKVGEHLRALSDRHQVLCVTHLPAIAALAHRHFKVVKRVTGGRTQTLVEELSGDGRVEEVADMIAGGAAHATARAEARRLLDA
jgi:DNA repair protein RecN (Recombination protein N)